MNTDTIDKSLLRMYKLNCNSLDDKITDRFFQGSTDKSQEFIYPIILPIYKVIPTSGDANDIYFYVDCTERKRLTEQWLDEHVYKQVDDKFPQEGTSIPYTYYVNQWLYNNINHNELDDFKNTLNEIYSDYLNDSIILKLHLYKIIVNGTPASIPVSLTYNKLEDVDAVHLEGFLFLLSKDFWHLN